MRRRHFVQSLATLPAWGLAAETVAAPSTPACQLAGIGACDWTLRLAANPDSLDLAKTIGLDGVQVDFGQEVQPDGTLPLHQPKLQEAFLARSAATGIAIPSLALGVLNKTAYKSDAAAEKWVLDSIPVAQRLKTPVVLLAFFGNGDLRNDEAGVTATIARLKNLAPRAADAGITYGIESWLQVADLERILDTIKSPAIKVYYDVGNMQKESEDFHASIRRLGRERICEVHAKDYDDLYGKGSMDFTRVKSALDAVSYTGWIHMEGIKIPNGVVQDMQFDLRHLRSIFQPERLSKTSPS
ncbi:MAG: sugar phosphate isomerase/epimerase family protein [Verrucomicrobium sp.]